MNTKLRDLTKLPPNRLILLGVALWWVFNLLQAGFTELANDEAYYVMFSQHLDWGYFDHPPITALLIYLGSFLGGELGVRLLFTLLQPIYIYLLWLIGKPEHPTTKSAGLFLLIASSMPILQLYGFIAVPDSPLMLFTALLLWAYHQFSKHNSWGYALLMGVAMGALAYSKYHGALVVFFLLLSNLRLLRNIKFYAAGLLALALILPHLYWQYNHDWVSLSYHLSDRNRSFVWGYLLEFILNLFAIFNPFLFWAVLGVWWTWVKSDLLRSPLSPTQAENATPAAMRALYLIAGGFILFFTSSTLRGYAQPQWVIPATFGIILMSWKWAESSAKRTRYTIRVALVTLSIMLLLRLVMIFNPIGLKFEIFDNKPTFERVAELAEGRPVIFASGYTNAAKYNYYTGGESYAQPSIDHRSSQYGLTPPDESWRGEEVLIEVEKWDALAMIDTLKNGKILRYRIVSNYTPIQRLEVAFSTPWPTTMTAGETLPMEATITNPYDYPCRLSEQEITLNISWKKASYMRLTPIEGVELLIAPHSSVELAFEVSVPDDAPAGVYRCGATLRNAPGVSWYNSPASEITLQSAQ